LTVADVEGAAPPLPRWWQQALSAQRREIRRVVAELMVIRGIMPLLMKARNGVSWTSAEKAKTTRSIASHGSSVALSHRPAIAGVGIAFAGLCLVAGSPPS
jgi:hypothetical protein